MNTFLYTAFGIQIESEIQFFELPVVTGTPDIFIQYGDVPSTLKNPIRKGVRYQISENEFLLKIDDIADYYITDGTRIVVHPHPGACDHDVRLFLMGSAIGALLHQRCLLPLHGSSVKFGDSAIIFAGDSGVGKSTIAAAFHQKGYPFLADDICVVSIKDGAAPMVVPGFQQLKLWDDALKKIGVKSENLQKVRKNIDMDKFFVPATDVCNHPVPVEAVFILDSHKESNFEILELKGMEKVPPLLDMTFRLNFIEGTESKAAHFTQCARIAASAKVFKITRPERCFLLNELVAKIQECL